MNKRAKGNRIEREFIQVLKNSGKFAEVWKPCHCRGNSDIFGLFDIIVSTGFSISLFQVKSNLSDYYKAKKQIREFMTKNKGVDFFVVLRVKKELWRITLFSYQRGETFEREFYVNDNFEEVDEK